MIPMLEHEFLDLILNNIQVLYSDWEQEVRDQITELYNYKLRFHIAERDLDSTRKKLTDLRIRMAESIDRRNRK